MRVVEDTGGVELHAKDIDRIVSIEGWEQAEVGFGEAVSGEVGAAV